MYHTQKLIELNSAMFFFARAMAQEVAFHIRVVVSRFAGRVASRCQRIAVAVTEECIQSGRETLQQQAQQCQLQQTSKFVLNCA